MRIENLPGAFNDLENIKHYYLGKGGGPLTLRLIRAIREVVRALEDNPYLAPPYEFVPGLRRLVMAKGAFLVFYRVGDHVEVVHLRRAERLPFDGEHHDAAL